MTLTLRAAARTDVGLRRDNNEDALFAGRRLMAIADGMGGQAYGEIASRVAILTVARLDGEAGGDMVTDLRDAIGEANEQLRSMIASDDDLDGMGTTFTALMSSGGRLALAHVGDSRAYLLRDNEFSQITHDHSLVQSLVDAGQITAEDAANHPSRSVITKALDGHADVDPDVGMLEARLGDRYLLCSDGLSDYVSGDTMAEALRLETRDEAADRLVQLALRAGGPDNVTVIVADVVDDTDNPEPSGVVIAGSADDLNIADDASTKLDTAAGRAAGLTRRRDSHERSLRIPHGPGRRVALVLGAAIVVAGVLVLGIFFYSRSQYYVGEANANGTVAIYRGVPGGVLGIDLSRLQTDTDVPVADLPEDDRDRVQSGISATSSADAGSIVTLLRSDGCQKETKRIAIKPKTPSTKNPSTTNPSGSSTTKTAKPHYRIVKPSWCAS